MKINWTIGQKREKHEATYNVPDSFGRQAVSADVRKATDASLTPVRSLVEHAMEGMADEGVPAFPGYSLLCGLSQNGIIRSGIEMRAKEMTRKWGELKRTKEEEGDSDRIPRIADLMETYRVKRLFREAAERCGFLGGCLLFVDTGEDAKELVNPLIYDAQTFRRGSLKGFRLIDPYSVYPGIYNSMNPLAEDYFKPKLWYVQGVPVHCSRFIRFTENELPTLIRPAYNFFGLSLAQRVLDAVSHFTRNREAASKMLEKISLMVLKTDMSDILAGGGDADMERRRQYFVDNWNYEGLAVIDSEKEDIVILNNSIGGITDIVRQSMEYVAAMFNEPATKIWGISPAGMNATGESDMRNHYDNIASLQEQMFSEQLRKLIAILQLNEWGNIDTSITFKFSPLSEDSEESRAVVNKTKADTYSVLNAIGAIGAEDIRDELIHDPNSGFNDLEPYERISDVEGYAGFIGGAGTPEEAERDDRRDVQRHELSAGSGVQ